MAVSKEAETAASSTASEGVIKGTAFRSAEPTSSTPPSPSKKKRVFWQKKETRQQAFTAKQSEIENGGYHRKRAKKNFNTGQTQHFNQNASKETTALGPMRKSEAGFSKRGGFRRFNSFVGGLHAVYPPKGVCQERTLAP